jgi:hypothetical protein
MATVFDQDTGYCTPDHISRYFQRDLDFGTQTNPTETEVEEMILEHSDEIDRRTHHSWRENTVSDEHHMFHGQYYWDTGRPVVLNRREIITPLDSAKGDAIEIWTGEGWDDWVSDPGRTEGRENDYWVDESMGELWLYRWFTWRSRPELRVSYRYGRASTEPVPRDVRKACAKLVAAELIETDQYTQFVPGNEDGVSPGQAADRLREDARETIEYRTEVMGVDAW